MSERYPDEWWLADFERRLSDGRLLTREESLGLITELRCGILTRRAGVVGRDRHIPKMGAAAPRRPPRAPAGHR
jgi:hypothetical protein